MDLYAEHILDHYRSPRRKELLGHASVEHEEKNAACGDSCKLQLHVENGVIAEVGWQGEGCAISQAGMSMLAEELAGMSVDDASQLESTQMLTMLGVPIGPRRMKCALLGLHTLKNSFHLLAGAKMQSWTETVKDGAARGN